MTYVFMAPVNEQPRETATDLAHPDWVRRLNLFGGRHPNRLISLDADELLAVAQQSTGLTDSSSDDDWETGYRQLVEHLDARAGLVLGRLSARAEIIRNLQTRLVSPTTGEHIRRLRRRDRRTGVHRGPPRTGTSILLETRRDPGSVPSSPTKRIFRSDRSPVWTGLRQVSSPEQEFWADITPTRRCTNCVPISRANASISCSLNSGRGTGR